MKRKQQSGSILASARDFSLTNWLTIAAALAIVGIFAIVLIRASGTYAVFEPESATLANGATQVADATAAGGSYVLFNAPSATPPPTTWTQTQVLRKPFAANSPWNTPALAGVALTPITQQLSTQVPYVNCETNSIPIYFSSASDPLTTFTWATSNFWRPANSVQVKAPTNAAGSAGTDDHNFVLVDLTTGLAHDFYNANSRIDPTHFNIDSYGVANLSDSGFSVASPGRAALWPPTWPDGNAGTRVVAANWMGGAITQQNITDGYIDHALAIALKLPTLSQYFRSPAVWGGSIGGVAGTGNVDLGARLVIPTTTAKPAGLSIVGGMIFDALKKYGAIVVDVSGATSIYMDPVSTSCSDVSAARTDWITIAPMLQAIL